MRILFLDIDGVLNSDLWYKSKDVKQIKKPLHHFDPKPVAVINNLVKKIEAKVVITSTWRNQYSNAELVDILLKVGLKIDVIGFTPDLKRLDDSVVRGNEILKWCIDNESLIGCKWKDYSNFAIIDDNTDFLLWQANNFFKTDRYCGITLSVKKEIERFFKNKK